MGIDIPGLGPQIFIHHKFGETEEIEVNVRHNAPVFLSGDCSVNSLKIGIDGGLVFRRFERGQFQGLFRQFCFQREIRRQFRAAPFETEPGAHLLAFQFNRNEQEWGAMPSLGTRALCPLQEPHGEIEDRIALLLKDRTRLLMDVIQPLLKFLFRQTGLQMPVGVMFSGFGIIIQPRHRRRFIFFNLGYRLFGRLELHRPFAEDEDVKNLFGDFINYRDAAPSAWPEIEETVSSRQIEEILPRALQLRGDI